MKVYEYGSEHEKTVAMFQLKAVIYEAGIPHLHKWWENVNEYKEDHREPSKYKDFRQTVWRERIQSCSRSFENRGQETIKQEVGDLFANLLQLEKGKIRCSPLRALL